MPLCLIGLGSNLGDRSGLLDEALVRLQRHPNIEVARRSRYHETLPVGGPDAQPAYLNAAAVLQTSLSPQALLAELQKVEADLGRQRIEHWGPRTIDLDLLLYDDLTLAAPDLVIPHPRMAWRRFVLEPAAEVAPEMLHPGTGWTIARLLDHLNQTPWYLAIAGPIGVGKSCLAGEIAEKSGARLLAEQFDPARLEAFYRNPSSHAWQIELEFLEQRAASVGHRPTRVDPARSADRERLLVRAIAGLCQCLAGRGANAGLPGSLGGVADRGRATAADRVAPRPAGSIASTHSNPRPPGRGIAHDRAIAAN